MKMLKEILNQHFSQLGELEIIIYLIAIGCIAGLCIVVTVYNLRAPFKISSTHQKVYAPSLNLKNQVEEQRLPESREVLCKPFKINYIKLKKNGENIRLQNQEKDDSTLVGIRR